MQTLERVLSETHILPQPALESDGTSFYKNNSKSVLFKILQNPSNISVGLIRDFRQISDKWRNTSRNFWLAIFGLMMRVPPSKKGCSASPAWGIIRDCKRSVPSGDRCNRGYPLSNSLPFSASSFGYSPFNPVPTWQKETFTQDGSAAVQILRGGQPNYVKKLLRRTERYSH